MRNDFLLSKLVERYTENSNPDVATTVEQGLIQLSSGIYTEEERFIFELLQNAVDSFEGDAETLKIKIILEDDMLVFMHNGSDFSDRDVEGLCDIGNGNKMGDTKKIGYKGIGFKSVFMKSDCVTVESGDYCFKFDREYWKDYWNHHWKSKYGQADSEKVYLMPWQIIPVSTTPPICVEKTGYNVITYIKLHKNNILKSKILGLLNNNQFLLFLQSQNIQMTFMSGKVILADVNKRTERNVVILSTNGNVESRWLIRKNTSIAVPNHLKDIINSDINTPQKLKNAKTFDLSFAVLLTSDDKIGRVEPEKAFVYTYLPTSFRFGTDGFPFLVNANFITDAGRQQLQVDSEWNKLIFSTIPFEFFNWMKDISSEYRNFYDILPMISYGTSNALETTYSESMHSALSKIAFIPGLNNPKQRILVKDAVMDKMEISAAISQESLINHINRTYNLHHSCSDFIRPIGKGLTTLRDYGVFVFDKSRITSLFNDEQAFKNISPSLDAKLVVFLYKYYEHNTTEQEDLLNVFHNTKFLIDSDGVLHLPNEIFFPSTYKDRNDITDNAKFIHNVVFDSIATDSQLLTWLRKLGVEDLSDITFIQNVICKPDYITIENNVEVIRFLYETNKKNNLFDNVSEDGLSNITLLTKGGELHTASDLYLSSKYKPEVDIECTFDEDIFVTELYLDDDAEIYGWSLFLKQLGVVDVLVLKSINVRSTLGLSFLEDLKSRYSELYNIGSWGSKFSYDFQHFRIYYPPFILEKECSIAFQKMLWSSVLSRHFEEKNDYVSGMAGFWNEIRDFSYFNKENFICWAFKNHQKLPAKDGTCRLSCEMYINSDDICDIAGSYLPIIDIDTQIDESWLKYLNLHNNLELDDYLQLLTNISNDEQNVSNNGERVSKIYQRLIDLDCLLSQSKLNKIRKWAKENKILSKDKCFVSPEKLRYISIEGFGGDHRAYIGSVSDTDKVVQLLLAMGVVVITEDSITPNFNGKCETSEIRDILLSKISPIAILSSGFTPVQKTYDSYKTELNSLIGNTFFYHCDKITLSYGDKKDVIEKKTYGCKNEFYYSGDIQRASSIEPLLTPLCKYLNIKGKERELFIILIEDYDGIRQNLLEKGYDVSLLENIVISCSGTFNANLNYHPDNDAQERNLITGFKGEIIIYEKLKEMGYSPVCPSISDKHDYERMVEWNGRTYFCKSNYGKYDISFESNSGVQVFVEVKATTMSKTMQENMPISYNELSMIEECNCKNSNSYIIARVFDVNSDSPDIYIFAGHLI